MVESPLSLTALGRRCMCEHFMMEICEVPKLLGAELLESEINSFSAMDLGIFTSTAKFSVLHYIYTRIWCLDIPGNYSQLLPTAQETLICSI